ncbi:hypothetical protein N5J53_16345 [Empedobacter sp. GD03644]|uniref:hypothetical protein n=1 Tax=Empedobacter sp. GD03644 TaxID=2975358 RepID=UPI00244D3A8F|nr:hypothetical protein [Empedobacter sp. GD03644]MDH2208580.1 hypothetical protein [Empedobacter sp. GD03644]
MLTIVAIAFLLLIISINFIKKSENQRKKEINENLIIIEEEISKLGLDELYDSLYEKVEKLYGDEAVTNLQSNTPFLGMSKNLLFYILGEHEYEEVVSNPNKVVESYFYESIPNVRSNAKRKYYKIVKFENDKVIWWDFINSNENYGY